MISKTNARPTVGAVERAETETTTCRASISYEYLTTAAAGRQIKVSDYLSRGRENAVPLRHLKQIMQADGRTVRLMIQQERLAGTPICADNLTGYFLPATDEEKNACVRSMRHRAGEIMKIARAIERAEG